MQFKDHIKKNKPKVYLIQDIPGTSRGEPKYNILGAQKYGDIVTMLPEFSQMILSPGPLIHKLRTLLKNYTSGGVNTPGRNTPGSVSVSINNLVFLSNYPLVTATVSMQKTYADKNRCHIGPSFASLVLYVAYK